MTEHYILDENIIELAAKGENDRGQSDFSCLTLMLEILKECHITHCSVELLQKYRGKLKVLERSTIRSASTVAKLIIHMTNQGKIHVDPDPPKLKNEENLPSDDVFLVRLASHTKSTIISTDFPLKSKVKGRNLLQKYKIKILHPSEVKLN